MLDPGTRSERILPRAIRNGAGGWRIGEETTVQEERSEGIPEVPLCNSWWSRRLRKGRKGGI